MDGFVWGRGSWDDKSNLCAILQAVDLLAAKGFQPKRTIYIASGHDEEAGTAAGQQGAVKIAALLRARGIKPEFALDEGLLVTEGIVDGVRKPVVLIGVAEKGYLTLSITAHARPDHSSMPPVHTAIGSLSTALTRLEQNPMSASLPETARMTFASLAPEMSGVKRVVLSSLWLFGPLVQHQLEQKPSSNAMLRTTTALTVLRAGNKEQVLPGEAEALVNFRLLPGDTQEKVIAHTKVVIADDSITVAPNGPSWPASPVSRTDTAAYHVIARTIHETFADTLVAPGLLVTASVMAQILGNGLGLTTEGRLDMLAFPAIGLKEQHHDQHQQDGAGQHRGQDLLFRGPLRPPLPQDQKQGSKNEDADGVAYPPGPDTEGQALHADLAQCQECE